MNRTVLKGYCCRATEERSHYVSFFTGAFFLGLQISICFFSHVERPYTAMRMPSTTNPTISETAIVGQLHASAFDLLHWFWWTLLMLRDYKTYWRVFLFISTYSFIWWNQICTVRCMIKIFIGGGGGGQGWWMDSSKTCLKSGGGGR